MATEMIPKEEDEQITFVRWCQINGLICHHCANEVGGSTRALKLRAIKAKKMGTSKGFPDLLVFVPIKGINDRIDAWQMLAIEMKRKKYSTTSAEQKEWIKILELAGVPSRVCKGAEEAVAFVREYMV